MGKSRRRGVLQGNRDAWIVKADDCSIRAQSQYRFDRRGKIGSSPGLPEAGSGGDTLRYVVIRSDNPPQRANCLHQNDVVLFLVIALFDLQ
jgi:hypothetical protein